LSWQLAAFSILAFALALGFGWYERTRPDARIVALVATLAALAAIGRIAFAAVPNVKPTTDIVLISGYALGGAPGFAVGAITGLTSNFFFGQGPWTPWQMAAWGATGMLGAALALVTRKQIGRWPLAALCGVVGFAFAAFQDLGDWVMFSDHSAAQLGVYVGRGIGFDFVHAVSCVLFALAFGPPLMRSIQRFARRLEVEWEPVGARAGGRPTGASTGGHPTGAGTAGGMALIAVLLGAWLASQPGFGGGAGGDAALASSNAPGPTSYLLSAQNADGGFGASPGAPSTSLYSGWAALGLAAVGHNPQGVRRGGPSLLGYIQAGVAGATDPGSLERTVLAARASGVSVSSFGGQDLVGRLQRDIRGDGSVGELVNLTSFAVLALRADGVAPPVRTLSWLVRQQDRDGGFNFATAGGTSDVDDTGAALQALAGAGGSAAPARRRAVGFLARQQDRDGGFPSEPGGGSNSQSTAWAIQGLLAAGVDPGALHRRGAPSPEQFLSSLIAADGHVRYSRSSDQTPVWVTGQALMALAGKSLPLATAPRAHRTKTGVRARTAPRATVTSSHKRRARAGAAHVKHRAARERRAKEAAPSLSALAADAACAAALALGPVGLD
jgi:energy-coupling factor transport system substrate-specific component